MVDLQTVCCMCGDVGFPDKLFHCAKCRNRFQHSYCSNFYGEYTEPIDVCDWCQCEEKKSSSSRHNNFSYSPARDNNINKSGHVNSAYFGEKTKQHHHHDEGGSSAEKATGKVPSPRTPTRRYKLLKDVMC